MHVMRSAALGWSMQKSVDAEPGMQFVVGSWLALLEDLVRIDCLR